MSVFSAYLSVDYMPKKSSEEGVGTPETGVANGCKLLHVGPRNQPQIPLQEQKVLSDLQAVFV